MKSNAGSGNLVDALKAQREELVRIHEHVVNRETQRTLDRIRLALEALDRAIEEAGDRK